jgi:plasmid stabilization system protein ParE
LAIEDFLGGAEDAEKTINAIFEKVRQLEQFPLSGPVQPSQHRREYRYLIADSYKIIYAYREPEVSIHAVFDTRQDPDKLRFG